MNHPFDLGWVNTGSDLLDFFDKAQTFVEKKGSAAVKIDGVNVSFKVVGDIDRKQFAVDRGSLKNIDISGITMDRVDDRFPEGHGMRPAIRTLLAILNKSINDIQPELETLGMWDDPSLFLNTEYVAGTTNVTQYDENFLAIHGLNQFYQRTAKSGASKGNVRPGAERPADEKAPSAEVGYTPETMQTLIDKLNPIANEYGFQVYGSVPTERSEGVDIDYSSILSEPFTVRVSDDREITKSLGEWLSEASNPRYKTVQLKNGKKTHALHKELYKAILDGSMPIVDLIEDADAEAAIYGAVMMHATRMLGTAVLKGLTSPMGDVMDHEGVVLRDDKLFGPNPVKITGEFIVGGMGSNFQTATSIKEDDYDSEADEWYELRHQADQELGQPVDDEDDDPVVDADYPKTVAIVPGAFKPPHVGHAEMVRKYAKDADRVLVLISQPTKSGRSIPGGREITAEDSRTLWELLVGDVPNVDVKLSSHATPISAAYALTDDPNTREAAAQKLGVEPLRRGDQVVLGASTKNDDWKRWVGADKYVSSDLELISPAQTAVAPSIHSPEYMGRLNVVSFREDVPSVKNPKKNPEEFHAEDMRYLIGKSAEDEDAIELLEDFVGPDNVFDVLSIFGIGAGLKEISTMAGGAVQGAPSAKGGPWRRSFEKFNDEEKKQSKLKRNENIDLNIIDGVMRLIMERGIMK
jgi:hypothetical protein